VGGSGNETEAHLLVLCTSYEAEDKCSDRHRRSRFVDERHLRKGEKSERLGA
jgi:hypothetical protein